MYLENVYVEVTRCLRDTNCNQKSNQTLANAFLRLKRIIGLDAKWLESHCATASHLNEKGTEKYLRGMKCKTALCDEPEFFLSRLREVSGFGEGQESGQNARKRL